MAKLGRVADAVDEPLRIGIVGCGGIAQRHAGAVADTGLADIVACCDVMMERAERYRDAYGCERSYSDYVEMVEMHDLDAVVLATWPNQHHEQILRLFEAGVRNILCEKPLTLTGAESFEVWRAARETGAFLMEGFMYRHHPATRRMEQLVAGGELGAVDHVRAAFSAFDSEQEAGDARDWRQRTDTGGGVPYDYASYCVNACNYFNSTLPVRVSGTSSVSERYGTINRLYGFIEYEGGSTGLVSSSKRSVFDEELAVLCAEGKLRLGVAWLMTNRPDLIIERSGNEWGLVDREHVPVDNDDPFRLQIENFVAVVHGEAEPKMPLAESVANAYTLEALIESAVCERSLELTLPREVTAELGRTQEPVSDQGGRKAP